MLEALLRSLSGDAESEIREKLQYLKQMKYGKDAELLPSLAVKLQLKLTLEFEKVQRQLGHLSRVAINTRADHNSAIHTVILQLKLPKNVKSYIN